MTFERITTDPDVMGGVPCIRGLRFPVATVVAMVADGHDAVHVRDLDLWGAHQAVITAIRLQSSRLQAAQWTAPDPALWPRSARLDCTTNEQAMRRSHDIFDAVIAAMTARAAALGQMIQPTGADVAAATAEGWIVIPDKPISALV